MTTRGGIPTSATIRTWPVSRRQLGESEQLSTVFVSVSFLECNIASACYHLHFSFDLVEIGSALFEWACVRMTSLSGAS